MGFPRGGVTITTGVHVTLGADITRLLGKCSSQKEGHVCRGSPKGENLAYCGHGRV